MSLSAEAERRKQRLLELKKRKRGSEELSEYIPDGNPDLETLPTPNETSNLPLSFRNYDPATRTTKLGYNENPLSNLPEEFETVEEVALNLAIEAINQSQVSAAAASSGEVDLFSLQPKRANWDLKRDVERKLERLKGRQDAAIAKLVRERLIAQQRNKEGEEQPELEGDLNRIVDAREREVKKDVDDD